METTDFTIDATIEKTIASAYEKYLLALESFDLRAGYQEIAMLIDVANKYFDEEKPWTIKEDPIKLRNILLNLTELLYHITILVAPYLPRTTEKMCEIFGKTNSKLVNFALDSNFRLTQNNKNIALMTIPLLFEKK